MRLHRAASYFDDSVIYDAYTGSKLGKGQLDPTDIFKLDGASVRRRVISVAPDFPLPTRRAVKLGAGCYLMGEPSSDEWDGSPIRTKYVLHQTPSLATVKTFYEALTGAAGRSMYASREWNKDVPDEKTSSGYFNDYHVFVANTETVDAYDLVQIEGQWHICHAVHPSLSGFKDAVCHEFIDGSGFESVTVITKTYVPATDSYTTAQSVSLVLRLRWQEQYNFLRESQDPYKQGDQTVIVIKAAWTAASAGDSLQMSDGRWRVLNVQDQGQTLALHVRRD